MITYLNQRLSFDVCNASMDVAVSTYTKSKTVFNTMLVQMWVAKIHTLFAFCRLGSYVLGVMESGMRR